MGGESGKVTHSQRVSIIKGSPINEQEVNTMKTLIDQLNALYVKLFLSLKDEKGQGLVEYALIVVLIALAAIIAMKYLGGSVNCTFCSAGSTIQAK